MLDDSNRLSDEAKKHLTAEQVKLLDDWHINSNLGSVSKFQAATQMYAANLVEDSVQKLIASNENIATSNDRHEKSMNRLTIALVFVGFVQIVIQIIQIWPRLQHP